MVKCVLWCVSARALAFCDSVDIGKNKKRVDIDAAEAMYKKAGAIDPFHANSIYNYAVLLDSSLKKQEVSRHHTAMVTHVAATRQSTATQTLIHY